MGGKTVGDRETADHRSRRGTEPPRMRNDVAAQHLYPSGMQTCRIEAAPDRPHHQVVGIQRDMPGALPFDIDDQPGIGCLDFDFVIQTQRETQAVEPRAQIGAGRCDDGSGPQTGGQGVGHVRSPPVSPDPAPRRRRRGRPGWG